MAKVTMPLMSGTASGGFAGTLVFANRKGKNVVRALVTPANPRNAGQTAARNAARVAAAGQKWCNAEIFKGAARASSDKNLIKAVTPTGQTWNSHLVKGIIGAGALNYTAATASWAALAANHAAWETAASATLDHHFPPVQQKVAVTNAEATPMTAGEAFFHYQYGLYSLGIAAAPGAVPPTYAA